MNPSPSPVAWSISLAARLEERWVGHDWSRSGDRIVVACSGGVDSLSLLHLLRFSVPRVAGHLEAAYFDHRLRSESGAEALWLRGVAGAWGIPIHLGRAATVPANEEEARQLRYSFFEELLNQGARWILTAHHADDQVETVLFRILRGTGVEGLRGIPEVRKPGILRPLLSFSRQEIEEYAGMHHLRPRLDASNRSLLLARNRIRHSTLPALQAVHPGAREGVLRLARHAETMAKAIELLLLPLRDALVLESTPQSVVLDRGAFIALEEPIAREVFRSVAGGLGARISESGTAVALEFMRKSQSGKGILLDDGLSLSRDFERLTLALKSGLKPEGLEGITESQALSIPESRSGRGELLLQGRHCEVMWGERPVGDGWSWLSLPEKGLQLPLVVRGWNPGDRMVTQGGEKKIKKLFLELRIPVRERTRIPLLVDARGEVLWIAGWRSSGTIPQVAETPRWGVGVRFADEG